MRPPREPLRIDGGRIVPDFRWPARRLVLEADGAAWHDASVAREDDAERQALLEAHGERVLRVTWRQAVSRPAQTWRASARPEPPTAPSVEFLRLSPDNSTLEPARLSPGRLAAVPARPFVTPMRAGRAGAPCG